MAFKQTLNKYFVYAFFFGLIPVFLTSEIVLYIIDNFLYIGFLKGISDVEAGTSSLNEMIGGIIPSSKPLLSVLFLYACIHIFLLTLGFIYRLIQYSIRNWNVQKYKYHQVKRFSESYQCYSNLMTRLTTLSDFIFEVLCSVTGAYFTYILLNNSFSDDFYRFGYLFINVFILLYIKKFLEIVVIIKD